MKNIALALVAFTIAAGCAYAKFSAVKPLPQPRAYVTMANEPEGTSTSTLASGGSGSTSGTITSGTWTVTAALPTGTNVINSSGMILTSTSTLSAEALIYIRAAPAPQLAISCDDDTCTVNARDMDQAKALLERIAARSVTMNIDVAHDANCHPVHEHDVIARQDTKPDIVASR